MAKDFLEDMIRELKKKKQEIRGEIGEREQAEEEKPSEEEKKIVEKIVKKEKTGQKQEAKKEETETVQLPQQESQKPTIEEEIQKETKKEVIERYGSVKIFRMPGSMLPVYFVPVPKPTSTEKHIITIIREAATRLISISPYKIRDPEQRRAVYKQHIIEILRGNPELHIPEHRQEFYADSVVREMVGYGVIDSLVRDDKLEEIMVIGPRKPVYVFHREHGMLTTNIEFFADREIEDLINKIGREIGRRVDISSPLLDARLADGSRVNATIPPASVEGATLTIRKFREDPYSIIDLIELGTLTPEAAAFLWLCADGLGTRPASILITGGTGSGKTTLLNVMTSFVPPHERIVSIEDTSELSLPLSHWIRLEARPPGLEGKGELTLDILTKNALRMRPDRIIVGEVRHAEAFTLFTAMNTGHAGSMGTVHSNSPQEAIARVTTPPMSVPEIMLSALDLIIVIHRIHDKKKGTIRRVTEIAEVSGALEGKIRTSTIFEREPVEDTIVRTAIPSNYLRLVQTFTGLSKKSLDDMLKKREVFLNRLAKEKIRSIQEVSEHTKEYFATERRE